MRFYVSLHFQSLRAIENGGASVRRGNSELIRVSLNPEQVSHGQSGHTEKVIKNGGTVMCRAETWAGSEFPSKDTE